MVKWIMGIKRGGWKRKVKKAAEGGHPALLKRRMTGNTLEAPREGVCHLVGGEVLGQC